MNAPTCQTCGKPLPAEAPEGICPACLLQNTFQDAPATSPAAVELELQQLSAAFPQLVIEEMIGQGGMGRVYRAQQPHLNRTVALKVLSAERAGDPEWLERFSREARALARLSHPHIVQVYDFGEKPVPYLLMEHVEGVNLRQAMQQGGLTARESMVIVPKLCEALHYAHEHDVLHRDIKPENILIDTEGRVKLVDFGLAKLRDEGVLPFSLTQSGTKLGTLAYMAPEQVEKPGDVDHRADIYSLGVVLYEMLTGELPLGRFPTPSEASGVDARLDGVVMRTLEKHREKRFQSAQEIKTSLEAAEKGPMPNKKRAPHPARYFFSGVAAVLGIVLGVYVLAQQQANQALEKQQAVRAEAEKARAATKARYEEVNLIRKKSGAWIASATEAASKVGQEKALQEIREALQSKDEATLRAACWALSGLHQIDFDHAPFRAPLRGLLESASSDVRQAALSALTSCGFEESDRARLDKLSTLCADEEISGLLFAYKALFKSDFTGANGPPALKLMERGIKVAQQRGSGTSSIDSRGVLGAMWGSRVSPEIEVKLVEWSHLGESADGDISAGGSDIGYNTFYHALSVVQNKSRVAVKRLMELAYHADTTNIAGRCFWGMNGTVPDPADQAYLAGEVIKLLGLRSNSYLWKGGLNILRGYARKDHLTALQELANRETLSAEHKETLQQIILRLSRPS